ncbi:cob(I)yrinic acid a,c-diamide adenosyltransferase [Thiobacter aerophilum]|uniref:Cobalamin adenosyltransferase n=1 Tax=Thiobacter aerophilum TaxID=3121275 RepID=A0ABV0EFF9_9BURK
MGHRLSRIITRTGDDGTTGLGDGSRLPKHAPRIATLGDIDELNSVLGLLLAEPLLPEPFRALVVRIQHELFELGGELSVPGITRVSDAMVMALEQDVEALNAPLPPLREFILPGGSHAAAVCHLARAVCRRAERGLVALASEDTVSPAALRYLNRLSDLLFVLARAINRSLDMPDVLWQPRG